ncbi:MAG: hypothetical protein E7263_04890 [Lachnospiraceae bacterium]|nr:hypothetical protein [Lachnospiraceae bacterium]
MDEKMIALLYLISLGVFFLFLVIATIAVIVGSIKKKKKAKKAKKYGGEDVDYDQDDEESTSVTHEPVKKAPSTDDIFEEAIMEANQIANETAAQVAKPVQQSAPIQQVQPAQQQSASVQQPVAPVQPMQQMVQEQPVAPVQPMQQMVQEQPVAPVQPMQQMVQEQPVTPVQPMQQMVQEQPVTPVEGDSAFTDSAFTDSAFAEDSAFADSAFAEDSAFADSAFSDSAFVNNLDGNAFPGSAFENPTLVDPSAMTAATMNYQQSAPGQSPVGNFYWYNREDVADRPDYKPIEMYYRHFTVADECIEDLLIEMYDCALVRTEDIRYIAYGIEPRHVAMRDVAATGSAAYNAAKKRKEPTQEDLDKIYRKWCSYVDKLFEIIEFRADNTTIGIIRDKLYEFGKSDVDVIIEGK